ncbi:HlyD family type I secretion periplasmic adaptor subunit [Ensifer sp. ENS07]|uniref:Membrane fusion protein (MFP) family protein n=1 Tax=Ensifer adhaerens TaxID=106592 RepID=A0A9Q8YEX3_ENSAD|nr:MULTISPECIES: HlyD family type I secretion periplasmic adaptor subunit [Ensifer]OWZ89297.1 secretion protein HlyD [Sinorhizobium sp. LM21]KQX51110.1 secretion protein HlyD [Ensifer sp. Root1298]KQX80870.1 secretion protein HlyD [Ensifer sp. Root1312]KRC19362.1 secretion protein HlyD [Ensifer sp. Root74]KRD64728.1 secretion protein HlyD [Ensifer sp. Root954]
MISRENETKTTKVEDKIARDSSQFGITSRIVVSAAFAATLLFGVGGWAAHARLSGAVITQGQVAISQQVKLIQHRDGGIVSEIAVRNGDQVKKGDVLIRLDETQTRVELAIVRGQLQQFYAMRARLKAERDGEAAVSFDGLDVSEVLKVSELKLFEANRRMITSQEEQMRLQITQLEEQIRGLKAQTGSSDAEREIVGKEIAKLETLLKSGLVPVSEHRDLLRQMARIDGSKGELVARIAEAVGQISELRIKLLAIDQNTRKETQTQIVGIEAKIAELSEREVAARDRLSRMEVRAPVDGLVYDLQVHTIGGIIAPGASVMSIVPEDDDLTVEIRIPPADIDRIAPGQASRLRFTVFNQRTTPELDGQVGVVAAATTIDRATGQPYYLATVDITQALNKLGDRKLMPGMPVEVYVQTDERTAISYLTKPFTDQMLRAFREE